MHIHDNAKKHDALSQIAHLIDKHQLSKKDLDQVFATLSGVQTQISLGNSANSTIQGADHWMRKWSSEGFYMERRQKIFDILRDYLAQAPSTMLDIGCGYAIEAGLIQKEFGTKLYLMDGDADWSEGSRDIGFDKASTMNFYLPIKTLKEHWDSRKLDYEFVNALSPNIPKDMKFDFIYSGKSCGFHYPLDTHKQTIFKHSHADTTIIIDLKNDVCQGDIQFEIKHILLEERLSKICEIRLT